MELSGTHGNGIADSRQGNQSHQLRVEQNLDTMNGAKTLTLDAKTATS